MKLKIFTDISTLIILLLLMPYSLIGEKPHEVLGVAMFALFVLHQILNRNWYKSLTSGKFNRSRILTTAINFLILILMILQTASGVLLSNYLFVFDFYEGIGTARLIHLAVSYWLFILVAVHLGFHFKFLKTQLKIKSVTPLKILAGAISIYGIYAFINRQLLDYMFLKSEFVFLDFSENVAFVIADFFAILILFSCIGYKIKN